MKHLILPDNDERRLIFYLSMEEFAAREMDGEAFFLWQEALHNFSFLPILRLQDWMTKSAYFPSVGERILDVSQTETQESVSASQVLHGLPGQ